MWWAERGILRGDVRRLRIGLAAGFVMGAAFLAFTIYDVVEAEFGWTANAYASLFFTIIGLHAMHVAAGLAMSAGVQAKAATGRIDGDRHMTVRMFAMYWHFVDAVWVVVFTSLYLTVTTMTTTDDAAPSRFAPPGHGIRLWFCVVGGIVSGWCTSAAIASLAGLSCAHPNVNWVMHAMTVVLCLADARRDRWAAAALLREPRRRAPSSRVTSRRGLRFLGRLRAVDRAASRCC